MRRRSRHPEEVDENLERWLLTYSDLITLLLATFVIMYAFSKIKEGNPNTVQIPDTDVPKVRPTDTTFLTQAQKDAQEKKFRRLRARLEKRVKKSHFSPYVRIYNDRRGLVIRLQSRTTFDTGSADLKPVARKILDVIYPTIRGAVGNSVRVEGHTDDVPIHTVAYPSNWHLSTARAISVIFYLIKRHHLSPDRFQAQGYGDRRPLVPNTTAANRAKNRRVDIVIVKRGMEYMQPGRITGGAKPAGSAPVEQPPGEPAPSEPAPSEQPPSTGAPSGAAAPPPPAATAPTGAATEAPPPPTGGATEAPPPAPSGSGGGS